MALPEQNVSILSVWRPQGTWIWPPSTSTENLPLALSGHHCVPAKSITKAPEIQRGRTAQADSVSQLSWAPSSCQEIRCAQRRSKDVAPSSDYAMALKIVKFKNNNSKSTAFLFQSKLLEIRKAVLFFFSSAIGNMGSGTSPFPPTMPGSQLACPKDGCCLLLQIKN